MNKKQLAVMWVGIIIIVLMGIFPPFIEKIKKGDLIVYNFKGYHFFTTSNIDGRTYNYYRIRGEFEKLGNRFTTDESVTYNEYMDLDPTQRKVETHGRIINVIIDYKRLYLQCALVIVIFGALIYTFKFKENFFAEVFFKTKKPPIELSDQKSEEK